MYPQTTLNFPNHEQNLREDICRLRADILALKAEVAELKAANDHLRRFYPAPSENAKALPYVIENLVHLREHFERQGALKRCSAPGCDKMAFDVSCFRLHHMAWCCAHNRIVTRGYKSCSVTTEERVDCRAVSWEYRLDWKDIVHSASTGGILGKKVHPHVLYAALLPSNTGI